MVLSTTSFRYSLIRRKNQKHLRIKVSGSGEVIVSSSENMAQAEIHRFIESRKEWIFRHLDNLKIKNAELDPMKVVYFNGTRIKVQWQPSMTPKKDSARLSADGDSLLVRGSAFTCDICLPLIEEWFRTKAVEILTEHAARISKDIKIHFKKLYIRNQKTRWGSSSGIGNISLNWRVIMMSPEVQDYLIIHELCHQYHFNHSRNFWDLVESFCPDYRKLNGELTENSFFMSLFR